MKTLSQRKKPTPRKRRRKTQRGWCLQDKLKADTKMVKAIDRLPGKKTMTERVVKRIMQAKKRLKL